mgnify:CR=1 FL=1
MSSISCLLTTPLCQMKVVIRNSRCDLTIDIRLRLTMPDENQSARSGFVTAKHSGEPEPSRLLSTFSLPAVLPGQSLRLYFELILHRFANVELKLSGLNQIQAGLLQVLVHQECHIRARTDTQLLQRLPEDIQL